MLDFQRRYDAGDRDRTFVKQYIDVLFKAYRPQLQKEVVSEYINGLSDTEFYTRETWDIIIRNLSDPLSPILKKWLQTATVSLILFPAIPLIFLWITL